MNTYISIGLLICAGMAYAASVPMPEQQQVEVTQVTETKEDESLQPEESRHGGHHFGHWGHNGHWGHRGHWGQRGHWGPHSGGHFWGGHRGWGR